MNEIEDRAWKLYTSHPLHRFGDASDVTKRWLGNLLHGCGGDRDKFNAALETLRDNGVTTLLRPAPLPEKVFPEAWPDPTTGQPLADPFERERELDKFRLQWFGKETPKLKELLNKMDAEIKADQRALFESNPELYNYRKELAAKPYATVIKMKKEEFERRAHNKRVADYFSREENHRKNVYLAGTRTDQVALENSDPEWAALMRREAQPIFLGLDGKGLFGKRDRQNRSLITRISQTDKGLMKVIEAGQEREEEWLAAQHEKKVQERIAAAIRRREEKLAEIDEKHGVERFEDGRIIVNAAGGAK